MVASSRRIRTFHAVAMVGSVVSRGLLDMVGEGEGTEEAKYRVSQKSLGPSQISFPRIDAHDGRNGSTAAQWSTVQQNKKHCMHDIRQIHMCWHLLVV